MGVIYREDPKVAYAKVAKKNHKCSPPTMYKYLDGKTRSIPDETPGSIFECEGCHTYYVACPDTFFYHPRWRKVGWRDRAARKKIKEHNENNNLLGRHDSV